MKRRLPLVLLGLALVAGGAWWIAARRGGATARRCNVLVISLDTCRADRMGFLGGGRFVEGGASPTPNLDRIAASSLEPREGLSPVPLTLPAHVAIFSGLDPDASGVRENDSFVVPPRGQRGYSLLAEDLRAAGWDTAGIVSGQPLERAFGLDAGFRVWVQPDRADDPVDDLHFRERAADAAVDDAIRFVQGGARPDAPWFLFVHFFDAHHPYIRRPVLAGLPEGPAGSYLAEISFVDRELGRLFAALGDALADTLVIVVGDHGEALGEHGEETHGLLLHDATLRVPFLVKLPRGREAPRADVLPRLIDVRPTVLAVTGAPSLDGVARDGRDLTQPAPASWAAYAETLYPWYQFQYARVRAVRDRKWKLDEGGGRERLFDWRADAGEESDRAAAEPAAVEGLRRSLWLHLARPRPGHAADREFVPSAAVPYFGGRPLAMAAEPDEEANRRLPRADDRWEVIRELDAARALIRADRPAEAAWRLGRGDAKDEPNPAFLFWRARSEDLAGRKIDLAQETRRRHFDAALALFERHLSLWDDGRTVDALIRLHLSRQELLGDRAELDAALARATGEINRGRARPLTWALRGQARERAGDLRGAAEDFAEAARLDPEDPRHPANLQRIRERLK